MRSLDWSTSPLGEPSQWPQSLRAVVSLLLNSKFPMFIAWGTELGFVYNDPYAEILGAKHPAAMGRRFKDIWFEIWDDIEPSITKALAGEATFHEDLPLMMRRKGFDEQTYFTFSYSPVHDETGGIGGMFCACTETTKEVEARTALQADKEDLHRLFTQAPGFIAVLRGPEHVFDLVNDAYQQLVGHRDLVGMTVRTALPEVVKQGFVELLDQVYSTGEPFVGRRLPVKLQRQPSGPAEDRFVDFIYQPISDDKGQVTGIFVEGHDVTEQVQAEEALRESEARLRAIFEQSTGGIVQCDATGRFTMLNQRFCEMVGYTEAELLGMRMQDITHPDDLLGSVAHFRQTVGNGTSFEIEKRYVRKDGSYVWANSSVAPIHDEAGRVQQVVAMVIDITARKRAEQVERRLAAIIESSDDAILSMGLDGTITSWNQGAERLYGYRAEEVIGQPVMILLPEDRQDEEPRILERIRWGERVEPYETVRCRKDGSAVEVSLTVSPVRNAEGRVIGASKIARDITERRRAERLQQTLVHELNHRVKNILATVQAIARQSFRSGPLDNRAREVFEARLQSLSRAHDLLTRENWDGAEIAAVVSEVLAPYPRQRFEIEGTQLRLPPRVALALTLALHELATNAAKYGALSVPTGRVAITWAVTPGDPPNLALRWQERGGPPVSPPAQKGFGSRLIERSLAMELAGEVHITYDPAGVICTVSAPMPAEWVIGGRGEAA